MENDNQNTPRLDCRGLLAAAGAACRNDFARRAGAVLLLYVGERMKLLKPVVYAFGATLALAGWATAQTAPGTPPAITTPDKVQTSPWHARIQGRRAEQGNGREGL